MSESISQTSLTNEPTAECMARQKWEHPTNRLKLQEVLQAARDNIVRNNMNNTWVSSREMRQRMQAKGVDIKLIEGLPSIHNSASQIDFSIDEQTSDQNHFFDSN